MKSENVIREDDDRRYRMGFLFWLFWRKVRSFRIVAFAYLSIFALSMLGLFFEYVLPGLNSVLAASLETPWGVVTSLFMHAGPVHLATNMIGLALYLFYFVFTNLYHSKAEIWRRTVFVSLLVFGVAVFSNSLWIFLYPGDKAIGSSGLVYAFIGAAFGFALTNIVVFAVSGSVEAEDFQTIMKFLPENRARRFLLVFYAVSYFLNGVFLVNFLLFFLYFPEQFLNVGPEVNGFVHALSFYAGFAAASFYSLTELVRLGRR